MPFEPRAGRPVYCPDCYAKIEKGEMKPVFSPKMSQNKVAASSAALSAIGIEFESTGVDDGGRRERSDIAHPQTTQVKPVQFKQEQRPQPNGKKDRPMASEHSTLADSVGLRAALDDLLKENGG